MYIFTDLVLRHLHSLLFTNSLSKVARGWFTIGQLTCTSCLNQWNHPTNGINSFPILSFLQEKKSPLSQWFLLSCFVALEVKFTASTCMVWISSSWLFTHMYEKQILLHREVLDSLKHYESTKFVAAKVLLETPCVITRNCVVLKWQDGLNSNFDRHMHLIFIYKAFHFIYS